MKRLFLILFITTSCFSIIKAQELNNTKKQNDTLSYIKFGVRVGVTFANISDNSNSINQIDTQSLKGVYGGFLLEAQFNKIFSLQPEFYYSQQGFIIKDESMIQNIHYLQLPFLVKIYMVKGFNIQLGPQAGYKIYEDTNTSIDSSYYLEDFDTGFLIGLEYKFDNTFFLNFRYNFGISEISKNSEIRNSVLQLGFGYLF